MNSKSVLWIILKNFSFRNYLFFWWLFLFFYNSVLQAQWVQTNGPANWNVLCLTISANSILAGIRTGGLFRSTNNGIIWEQVHNGFTANLTNTFVVQGDSIFAGTNDGIFLSTDEGINWAQIGLHGYTIYSIAVSHNYIFAGTDFSGMFLSS